MEDVFKSIKEKQDYNVLIDLLRIINAFAVIYIHIQANFDWPLWYPESLCIPWFCVNAGFIWQQITLKKGNHFKKLLQFYSEFLIFTLIATITMFFFNDLQINSIIFDFFRYILFILQSFPGVHLAIVQFYYVYLYIVLGILFGILFKLFKKIEQKWGKISCNKLMIPTVFLFLFLGLYCDYLLTSGKYISNTFLQYRWASISRRYSIILYFSFFSLGYIFGLVSEKFRNWDIEKKKKINIYLILSFISGLFAYLYTKIPDNNYGFFSIHTFLLILLYCPIIYLNPFLTNKGITSAKILSIIAKSTRWVFFSQMIFYVFTIYFGLEFGIISQFSIVSLLSFGFGIIIELIKFYRFNIKLKRIQSDANSKVNIKNNDDNSDTDDDDYGNNVLNRQNIISEVTN